MPNVGSHPPNSAASAVAVVTMKHRRSFLAAARGRKSWQPGLQLHGRCRTREPGAPIQIGFTASRRVGGAVVRNRAKRRLRAVAHSAFPQQGHAGWDYVLVARPQHTVGRPFALLATDLTTALAEIHRPRRRPPRRERPVKRHD